MKKAPHTLHESSGVLTGAGASIGFKLKVRDDRKKLKAELRVGPSFFHDLGKATYEYRLIDKENDRYFKTYTIIETEQECHRCDEPLSQHTGRGSARKTHTVEE